MVHNSTVLYFSGRGYSLPYPISIGKQVGAPNVTQMRRPQSISVLLTFFSSVYKNPLLLRLNGRHTFQVLVTDLSLPIPYALLRGEVFDLQ